jgi:hypothetical protein
MAYLTTETGVFSGDTSVVDDSAIVKVGTRAKDKDGNDVKLMKKKEEPVTASVDTSVYESVAQRFRKAYKKI